MWLPLMLVVAGIVVGTIGAVWWTHSDRPDPQCVAAFIDFAPKRDRTVDQTLSAYLADHLDGPLPVTGWTKSEESADRTVFTSEVGGHSSLTISGGQVRSSTACPD
jgi:hypothetical protein